VDGYYYGKKADNAPADLAALRAQRAALIERVAKPETRRALIEATQALAAVDADVARLPPPSIVYAGTIYHGGGTFVGTGAQGGKPRPIHLLARGDVKKPGAEVGPGAVRAVPGLVGRFEVPKDEP